jgi:quinol-cytochrome oxidoreductase complex cytochrome b subunit
MEINRRLRKTFLFHLRPRNVSASAAGFTYTWGLGGAAALLVLLSMASGVMLKFAYTPMPERAYGSIVGLQTSMAFGPLIRNVHHWSANILVLTVFLHMLRVFYTGAYQPPRGSNWWIGLVIFAAILASNFTGYLLPWDQLAYWAVTICTSMVAYLPVIGDDLRQMMVGGSELGPRTLANFYALHTAVLPAVLIAALPFHFWRIRKAGGLAAKPGKLTNPEVKEVRLETIPHLLVRELAMAASVIALVMIMAALWDAPLGPKANPGLSPNPTKAPWYFAGLQEMLVHLHPLLAVAVIPLLVIIALALLPIISRENDSSGIWFGSPAGRRTSLIAALTALIATPVWIIGYANGVSFLWWLAPVLGLALLPAIYGLSKKMPGASAHDGVQAMFTFLFTVFILLTITGTWFRGTSMALTWPWQ